MTIKFNKTFHSDDNQAIAAFSLVAAAILMLQAFVFLGAIWLVWTFVVPLIFGAVPTFAFWWVPLLSLVWGTVFGFLVNLFGRTF